MSSLTRKEARQLEEPVSTRKLTTRESIILLEASRVNGSVFPPWTSINESEFVLQPCFKDPTHFAFSKVQLEEFAGWRRRSSLANLLRDQQPAVGTGVATGEAHDLVQDVTTDCSVVASLCAVTARTEQGLKNLFVNVIHPWDQDNQRPGVSISGKYVFRFHFNGCYRKVVIDDRLPLSKSGRKFFVVNRSAPTELWPALLEKAYLKVRGGYSFPGSNSGCDLSILTGWIPEQVFLHSDNVDPNTMWHRLFHAFQFGDVLITIGTGKIAAEEEEVSELVSQHDYAVIDMDQSCAERALLVKNPWAKRKSRKNSIFSQPDNAKGLTPLSNTKVQVPTSKDSQGRRLTPGASWMDLDSIFHSFESLYLNWNPGLFRYRQDQHFTWDLSASQSPEGCFRTNPQFSVQSQTGGLTWLLLSRHFHPRSSPSEYTTSSGKISQPGDGFISMYAFNSANRVLSCNGFLQKSQYVDSPYNLLKLDLPTGSLRTIVVSQQSLPRIRCTLTLSCLSLNPVTLTLAREKYAFTTTQQGLWTKNTAGGNSNSPTYHRNPQYSIRLDEVSDLSLTLETPSRTVPLHVALFLAGGKRLRNIARRDVIGDTGGYTNGFAFAEVKSLTPGVYTAVCSTFEPGQLTEYQLHIFSTSLIDVQKIPLPGAGKFQTRLRPVHFLPGISHLRLPLGTDRINRVSVTAYSQILKPEPHKIPAAPLRVSIVSGVGHLTQVLAVSSDGEFAQPDLAGTFIHDVNIQPEGCFQRGLALTIERLITSSSDFEEMIDVYVQSEEALDIGEWMCEG